MLGLGRAPVTGGAPFQLGDQLVVRLRTCKFPAIAAPLRSLISMISNDGFLVKRRQAHESVPAGEWQMGYLDRHIGRNTQVLWYDAGTALGR